METYYEETESVKIWKNYFPHNNINVVCKDYNL